MQNVPGCKADASSTSTEHHCKLKMKSNHFAYTQYWRSFMDIWSLWK